MKNILLWLCLLLAGPVAHAQQLLCERVLLSAQSQRYSEITGLVMPQPDSVRLVADYLPSAPANGLPNGIPLFTRLQPLSSCDTLPRSSWYSPAPAITAHGVRFFSYARAVRRGQTLVATPEVVGTALTDSTHVRLSLFNAAGRLRWSRALPSRATYEQPCGLLDAPGGGYYVSLTGGLARLDSTGTMLWKKRYRNVGNAQGLAYTRSGNLLLYVVYNSRSPANAFTTGVLEVNQAGDSLRVRPVTPNITQSSFGPFGSREALQPLRDGGFAFVGRIDSAISRPFLARLDANLNVVWMYAPRVRVWNYSAFTFPYELSDGSVVMLESDSFSGRVRPYWLLRFSPTGALQQRYAFTSQILPVIPRNIDGTFGFAKGLVPLSDSTFKLASSNYYSSNPSAPNPQIQVLTYLAHLRVPGLPRVVDSHYLPAAMPTATRPTTRLDWQLYPNPANETLTVPLPAGAAPAQLRGYDALGRLVLTQPVPAGGGAMMVAVAGWPPGLYVLTLVADGHVLARQRVSVYRE